MALEFRLLTAELHGALILGVKLVFQPESKSEWDAILLVKVLLDWKRAMRTGEMLEGYDKEEDNSMWLCVCRRICL